MSNRVAAYAFALLVCATVAAFFVTQRLKRTPPIVQSVQRTPLLSPHRDGRHDIARISFRLKHSDDVSVSMVSDDGAEVRRLVTNRHLVAYRRISLTWDGRADDGRLAPDGVYRPRVGLRRQGRSVTVPAAVTLDATPPRPRVSSVKPDIFPERGSGAVTARVDGSNRVAPTFFVYRTDPPRPRLVRTFTGRSGSPLGTWDGRYQDGRKASPGTYLVAVRVLDKAGNSGTDPAALPPRSAAAVRGHPGVTVRFIGVTPPLQPVVAGADATFFVDARRRRYQWDVRRLGAPRPRKSGFATRARLRLKAPRGSSGVYLLEARSGAHRTAVPFAVQARRPAHVLLVLPAITWEGHNPVDDDGDGIPNTLDNVLPLHLLRPFAGSGLPQGFAERIAPLLVHLDRTGLRYDITTDLALAQTGGARLRGRAGVLLAGDERWLPPALQARLRAYVRAGGHLATLGVDSLRRGVRLTRRRLLEPTGAADRDVFGARLRPVVRRDVDLLAFPDDRIQLFFGTDGSFPGYHAFEEVDDAGPGRLLAAAGPAVGHPVIVASRLGKGFVIRFGLPELAARASHDSNAAALLRRTWTLLSR